MNIFIRLTVYFCSRVDSLSIDQSTLIRGTPLSIGKFEPMFNIPRYLLQVSPCHDEIPIANRLFLVNSAIILFRFDNIWFNLLSFLTSYVFSPSLRVVIPSSWKDDITSFVRTKNSCLTTDQSKDKRTKISRVEIYHTYRTSAENFDKIFTSVYSFQLNRVWVASSKQKHARKVRSATLHRRVANEFAYSRITEIPDG